MCSYICTNQTVSPSCFDLPGPRNISACVAWRLAGGHHQHAAWSKMRVMTVMREVLRNPESRLGWSLTRGDYPVSDWLSFCVLQFQALGSSPGITRLSSPLEFGKVMVGILGWAPDRFLGREVRIFVASMQEHILHHALLVDCHTLFPRHMLCTQCTIFSPLPLRFVRIGWTAHPGSFCQSAECSERAAMESRQLSSDANLLVKTGGGEAQMVATEATYVVSLVLHHYPPWSMVDIFL